MSARSKNILIVDDDETITWTIATAIRKRSDGFQIYQARSGLEAFGYIKQLKSLDLLITDIHMPQLTGIDLLHKLKDFDCDPAIIVITGFGSDSIHQQVEQLGAVRYFTKPFDITEIVDAVHELLERRDTAKHSPGFSGSFGQLNMVDILQINCLIRKTGLLKVQAGDNQGKIYFNDGEIIHAEASHRVSEEAIYYIIDWGCGGFEFIQDVAPKSRTISKSWEFILIEHSRRKDQQDKHKPINR